MRDKLALMMVLAIACSCGSHRKAVKDKGQTIVTKTKTDESPKRKGNDNGIVYKGEQWVRNISLPARPTQGLQNKHIALWASHGRFYNAKKDRWEWQRPNLYCTNEDLFTQTIVLPYLIPMLEKAGATVFTPRERDWQRNEVVVDNDDYPQKPSYCESVTNAHWTTTDSPGYGNPVTGVISDNINPFTLGSARETKASKVKTCDASYQPNLPEGGRYAVYVSYQTVAKSVDDAEYIVYHKGQPTVFHVNQKMGGGTWVYLGTFDFDKGCSAANRVVVSNVSDSKGVVTTDAVRFGGGMGNVARNGKVSGLPRALEGSRYYAQYAGAPEKVYNGYKGEDDYKDDINTRSLMTNWLAGGSCYLPDKSGKGVPFELSLAVHSDAGYAPDMKSVYGSLAICTTANNNGLLASGISRQASKHFASCLLNGLNNDMTATYGKWAARDLYDRNYSETRLPEVPSAIIETLSHQSFPDMALAQDPNVRFTMARSLYKTILKFVAEQHDLDYTVAPLAPTAMRMELTEEGTAVLQWKAQTDKLEGSAKPSSYIVYTAIDGGDFDNGMVVKGCKTEIQMLPNRLYRFKVAAANKGGESFTSETLATVYNPQALKTVLVINGFRRVAAPKVVDDGYSIGFNMETDPGVADGWTMGWCGQQTNFNRNAASVVGENGLGYSGEEMVGQLVCGNTFDYSVQHAKAIMSAGRYNVVSVSAKAVEDGSVNITNYPIIDYIMGLEKSGKEQVVKYKSLPVITQSLLTQYIENGGSLLISGAYLSSDMTTISERTALTRMLHIDQYEQPTTSEAIYGMGTSFDIYNRLNGNHYAATSVDVLTACKPAFCALTYSNGQPAAVAYKGESYRTFAMGFPFECIKSEKKQGTIMRGILKFLDKQQ